MGQNTDIKSSNEMVLEHKEIEDILSNFIFVF